MDRVSALTIAQLARATTTSLADAEKLIAQFAKAEVSWALVEEATARWVALESAMPRRCTDA
jgi:hypothetical protein